MEDRIHRPSGDELRKALRCLIGREALYREGGRVCLARLHSASLEGEKVVAGFELVPMAVLGDEYPSGWTVFFPRSGFSINPPHLGDGYLGLSVYFDLTLVEDVRKQAQLREMRGETESSPFDVWDLIRRHSERLWKEAEPS